MANGVGAFDIQSGFNVGRQMAGPNALGVMAKNILDQVNNISGTVVTQKMLSPILAQRAGMEEEQKMRGLGRFFQSPEGQSYMGAMMGGNTTSASMQAMSPPTTELTPTQPSLSPNSSVNDYIYQLDAQRQQPVQPRYRRETSYGMTGPSVRNVQTDYGIRDPSDTERTKLEDVDSKISNAETILNYMNQHQNKLHTGTSSLDPTVNPQGGFWGLGKVYTGHFQPEQSQFLNLDRQFFLPYRVSAEGLRFVQGGVSYAQSAVPDPQTDPLPVYMKKAKAFIAAGLHERSRLLNTMHQSGTITDSFPTRVSPHTQDLPAADYFNWQNQYKQNASPFQSVPAASEQNVPAGFQRE